MGWIGVCIRILLTMYFPLFTLTQCSNDGMWSASHFLNSRGALLDSLYSRNYLLLILADTYIISS
ncbi:hypothetical protein BANRA_00094 [Escherichia coli]|uniref:Uncharacterized protein n=1 Tax=Escherichia coli TaxID=562 RepID=A0A3P5DIZ1_ECOLX|nr:hypothetical protein FJMB80155_43150 [Escherichia coli]GHK78592.1 hypothetical protein ECZU13_44570 [Escherichia coli]GHK79244.1 hypothetical protein ECZU15_01760 [Escherichia coli]VCY81475.1 hypothetical protein BANRA_00094 [Escherichia coli]